MFEDFSIPNQVRMYAGVTEYRSFKHDRSALSILTLTKGPRAQKVYTLPGPYKTFLFSIPYYDFLV